MRNCETESNVVETLPKQQQQKTKHSSAKSTPAHSESGTNFVYMFILPVFMEEKCLTAKERMNTKY